MYRRTVGLVNDGCLIVCWGNWVGQCGGSGAFGEFAVGSCSRWARVRGPVSTAAYLIYDFFCPVVSLSVSACMSTRGVSGNTAPACGGGSRSAHAKPAQQM